MLTLHAQAHGRFCDGLSRRDFLRIGGLALGGLSLPQILRAEAASGVKKSHKAVIMIFLPGGPSHQDIFDLKMDAPSEIRGEFKPIGTNVDGIQITEHLPRLARMMDRCTLIRSMSDCDPGHDAFQCLTGRSAKQQPLGGWPSFGSIVSKVQGAIDPAVPPFVGLAPKMGHMEWARSGAPGFLGVAHSPFEPNKGGGAAYASMGRTTRPSGMGGLYSAFGVMGINAHYAIAARRHFAMYGTTSEQLGAIAVAERQWAAMNPLAEHLFV